MKHLYVLNAGAQQLAVAMNPFARRQLRKQQRVAKREAKNASYRPNGARETERRRRQIAAGRLTVANGLAA